MSQPLASQAPDAESSVQTHARPIISARQPQWQQLPALKRQLAQTAGHYDLTGAFPSESFALLHRHGFLALSLPPELGGAGGNLQDLARVIDEVAQGDPSVALILSMYYSQHARERVLRSWPSALYEQVVRTSLEKVSLINGLTNEPELGSALRGGTLGTVARRVPEGWRITGRKRYATGSRGLSWFTTAARVDEDPPRNARFLVPADAPGVRIIETWDQLGMRATSSHDVVLEDVLVPAEHHIKGVDAAGSLHISAWLTVAWNAVYLGVAKAARDELVAYAHERAPTSLGRPIATLPRIRQHVGRIEVLINAADRLTRSLARDYDAQPDGLSSVDIGTVKEVGRNNAIEAVQLAVQAIGNAALARSSALQRHFRNVQFGPNHPPFSDATEQAAVDALYARHADRQLAAATVE